MLSEKNLQEILCLCTMRQQFTAEPESPLPARPLELLIHISHNLYPGDRILSIWFAKRARLAAFSIKEWNANYLLRARQDVMAAMLACSKLYKATGHPLHCRPHLSRSKKRNPFRVPGHWASRPPGPEGARREAEASEALLRHPRLQSSKFVWFGLGLHGFHVLRFRPQGRRLKDPDMRRAASKFEAEVVLTGAGR